MPSSEEDCFKTGLVECHGTGTPIDDPLKAEAVSRVFGKKRVMIDSVEASLGHPGGASGRISLLKAVLSFENGLIPHQISIEVPATKPQSQIGHRPS
jgi:acyl transferase domain-containing protein